MAGAPARAGLLRGQTESLRRQADVSQSRRATLPHDHRYTVRLMTTERRHWEYGNLDWWRVRPPLNLASVYPTNPWDWPWRARWRVGAESTDYGVDELEGRSL